MKNENRPPFSWTLLTIALLSVFVYSLGVTQPLVRNYLVRESNNRRSVTLSAEKEFYFPPIVFDLPEVSFLPEPPVAKQVAVHYQPVGANQQSARAATVLVGSESDSDSSTATAAATATA